MFRSCARRRVCSSVYLPFILNPPQTRRFVLFYIKLYVINEVFYFVAFSLKYLVLLLKNSRAYCTLFFCYVYYLLFKLDSLGNYLLVGNRLTFWHFYLFVQFKNRMIGQVACDMLLLLCDHAEILLQQNPDIPRAIVEVRNISCTAYIKFLY